VSQVGEADEHISSPQRQLWERSHIQPKAPEERHNEPNFHQAPDACGFGTKDRQRMIRTEIRSELFSYLGGLTRELKGKAYGINGTNDHVHMLIGLPPNVATSDALRFIKANSSGWLHEKWKRAFA
jgi:hypothetical protein